MVHTYTANARGESLAKRTWVTALESPLSNNQWTSSFASIPLSHESKGEGYSLYPPFNSLAAASSTTVPLKKSGFMSP